MKTVDDGVLSQPIGCPADPLMKLLAREWSSHIIWSLRTNGTTRFGALRRSLPGPVSARVLSARLKELESAGLVERRAFGEKPMHVEYSLSAAGLLIDEDFRRFEGHLDTVQPGGA